MSQNSRGMTPLNWQNLVEEALRRRKEERLTQREHAALANVSIPTMSAFERAETTLTLAKAFDILRVVGLVDEPKPGDAHDRFVRDAFKRWQSLAETLPADSPGRFPHGWFRFDYQLVGELRGVSLNEFKRMLEFGGVKHTGWPLFLTYGELDQVRYEVEGIIECWLHQKHKRLWSSDPSLSGFWCAIPSGSFFTIRGYQEDGQETFQPATIFDTALPIWRIAEALLHAEQMATMLKATPQSTIDIRFRAVYSGLSGRILRSWSNPLNAQLAEGQTARSDEAVIEDEFDAADIGVHLEDAVLRLVAELYGHFGVVGISRDRVVSELAQMRKTTVR
jgi:transcriptional regulator with XRE-family HTH domain